jgi:hypothetical protein
MTPEMAQRLRWEREIEERNRYVCDLEELRSLTFYAHLLLLP